MSNQHLKALALKEFVYGLGLGLAIGFSSAMSIRNYYQDNKMNITKQVHVTPASPSKTYNLDIR